MGSLLALPGWGRLRATRLSGPVRIATSNPLTRGLCSLFYPTGAHGAQIIDLVTGKVGTLVSGAIINVGPFGWQLDVSSGSAYGTTNGIDVKTGQITVAALYVPQATTRGDVFTRWHNGATTGDQFWLASGVTAGVPQFGYSYGSGQHNSSSTGTLTVTIGRPNLIAGHGDGANVAAYLNGRLVHSVGSTIDPVYSSPTATWMLGNNINGDGHLNGQILGAAVWNRAFYLNEMVALASNFDQLVERA